MTPKGERGQAIVVIALIFAVLCGMLALAVDGGRGFVARREIQNAADASADAAAFAYARSLSFTTAEAAQVQSYMDNRAISGVYQCAPLLSAPGTGQTFASHCTFPSDSTQDMAIAVTDRPCPVCVEQFWTGGQEQMATAFIQVLGAGPTFPVGAQGVAWWAQGAYPSGPYGFGQPPGTSGYGNPPTGWTGPWPPSGSGPSGGPGGGGGSSPSPGGGSSPSPSPGGGGGGGGSCNGTCPPPNGGSIPPVVLALSGACGGSGDALTLKAENPVTWPAAIGNVVSYGDVVGTVTGASGASVPVAADTTAFCQAPTGVVGWCYPSGLAPGSGTPPCTGGSTYQYGKPAPPGYHLQPVNTTLPTSTPGTSINIEPGIEPVGLLADAAAHTCTFMAAGVYRWQQLLRLPSGVLSNELRPPDEPAWGRSSPTTTVQSPQFWDQNGANCAGKFGLTPVLDVPGPGLPAPAAGLPLPAGVYAVRITSVRQDNGVTRESPASICRTLSLAAPSALEVSVSNAPGATAYNVYLSTVSINTALTAAGLSVGTPGGTCAGPFYQLGQIAVPNPQLETNADTSGCPSLTQTPNCSLGVTVGAFDQTQLNQIVADISSGTVPPAPAIPNPPCLAAVSSSCIALTSLVAELQAPAGSGLADQDPVIDSPGTSNSPSWTSDRADWGYCVATGTTAPPSACPDTPSGYDPSKTFTPGAVQIQETDASSCFDFSSGTKTTPSGGLAYLFSGYQYAWALAVQPSSDGTCSDYFAPAFGSEFFGHVDTPQATAYAAGNNGYLPFLYGTFTALVVSIDSSSGVAVYFVPPPDNTTGYGTAVP